MSKLNFTISFIYLMLSFINSLALDSNLDNLNRECLFLRSYPLSLDLSSIESQNSNISYYYSLALICTLSGFEDQFLTLNLYSALNEILKYKSENCTYSSIGYKSEFSKIVDNIYNFPTGDSNFSNQIRANILSCVEDNIRSRDNGTHTKEELILAQNSIDLMSGFISLAYNQIFKDLRFKNVIDNSVLYLDSILNDLTVQNIDYRYYWKQEEMLDYLDLSIDYTRQKFAIQQNDYLSYKTSELELIIDGLKCSDGSTFRLLYWEISTLYTQLSVLYLNITNLELFNLRFNIAYHPDFSSSRSNLIWIAYHSRNYSRNSEIIRYNIEASERAIGKYTTDDIKTKTQRLSSLFEKLISSHLNYYTLFHSYIVNIYSIFRTNDEILVYKPEALGNNICIS